MIVGRAFKAFVTVPLRDAEIEKLRFRVTSPPDTGVLLDHLRFAPSVPQRVLTVEHVPMTLPALVGRSSSPLLKLRIKTEGDLEPRQLEQLAAFIPETSLQNGAGNFTVRFGLESNYDIATTLSSLSLIHI